MDRYPRTGWIGAYINQLGCQQINSVVFVIWLCLMYSSNTAFANRCYDVECPFASIFRDHIGGEIMGGAWDINPTSEYSLLSSIVLKAWNAQHARSLSVVKTLSPASD